jgi:uncharacterized protein YfaS (alpha-2-macroglobulin family)
MSLNKPLYRTGDTARLTIAPWAAGTALIAVMSNRLIARHAVDVAAGQTVIPLKVTADWRVGAYVVATVIRPMDVAAGRNPARALGLAHAAVDPVGKALSVAIHAPDVTAPRGVQPVRLTVTGDRDRRANWRAGLADAGHRRRRHSEPDRVQSPRPDGPLFRPTAPRG